MQHPPPVVHPSGVPSSAALLHQQQLLPLHYPYALQQPQNQQGVPFPLITSAAVDPTQAASTSSSSSAAFSAQFVPFYPLGGPIANFMEAGHEQLQKQQQQQNDVITTLTGTVPSHSSGIIETVKKGQQKQQSNGETTAKAEQLRHEDELRKKSEEEKCQIECPYGSIGGMFGAISGTDYGGWMATASTGHGLVPSYPPLPPPVVHQQMPPAPAPCAVTLGTEELGVIYGTNGLMNVSAAGLHYEIDPAMGAYDGGVWTGGEYYHLQQGTVDQQQQAKLLAEHHQQYLNAAADAADGRYAGEGNGAASGLCANGTNAFYSSLHQQGMSSSALVDQSLFHPNSALPPAPSQLSTDPIYGQPVTFGPISMPPPSVQTAALPPALSSSKAAISSNALFTPSQNGGPASLHQLDPSPSQRPSNNFYPTSFGENVPLIGPSNSSSNAAAPTLGPLQTGAATKKGGTQKNGGNAAVPMRQNPSKRGRLMKTAAVGGRTTPALAAGTGRPGSSQATDGEENSRAMGGEGSSGSGGGRKLSRSRSVAKESSDDDKSAEEKEQERRNANNTRERIRVRDINAAFKELARLCSQHMPNVDERSLTKLHTLLKAVELIPHLEKKVEEKNRMMNARKESIKHRLNGPPPLGHTPTTTHQPQPFDTSLDPSASLAHCRLREGLGKCASRVTPTDGTMATAVPSVEELFRPTPLSLLKK